MRAPRPLELWGKAALRLLFPARCAACVTRLPADDEGAWCRACAEILTPLHDPKCAVCGEPYVGIIPGPFECPNCADLDFHFEFAVSAWRAEGPVREAIHRFKYSRQLQLRLPLARLAHGALSADARLAAERDWVLVPVPLHPKRKRERGFNQSAELARGLQGMTGLPMIEALRRIRYTTTQASLSRQARLENLTGAFAPAKRVRDALRGRNVLLIDDVFTTGSTADACAKVLRRETGAARVAVLTAARG